MSRKIKLVLLIIMLSSLLALCGCAFKNETLDKAMADYVNCLNTRDVEGAMELYYPGKADEGEIREIFAQLPDEWQSVDPAALRLSSIETKVETWSDYRRKTIDGKYNLNLNGSRYVLELFYLEDDNGSGLTDTRLSKQPLPIGASTIIGLLLIVLTIYTIVDIVRRKPRFWGLWIAVVLLGISFIPVGLILYWIMRRGLKPGKQMQSKAEE